MVLPLIPPALVANQLLSTAKTKPKPDTTGKDGDVTTTTGKDHLGRDATVYWKWDGKDWTEISKGEYSNTTNTSYVKLGEPNGESASTALRYPYDVAMAEDSDYVLFEFYKYQPPFKGLDKPNATLEFLEEFAKTFTVAGVVDKGLKALGVIEDPTKSGRNASEALALYNQSVNDEKFYEKTSRSSVVLYMPEDISTGYKAQWSGKKFSNLGANLLATAGSGNPLQALNNLGNAGKDAVNNLIPQGANKVIRETIGAITGESISADDVFGSTRGVILNPNVELLFGGVELRNFQLRYKLVPRNYTEGLAIKDIINTFRAAMLPNFADGDELTFSQEKATSRNFIKVPNVCKVSFMKGSSLNDNVPQYKMCAITQVDINYTPDGVYATLENGEMVAYELTLSFQETKLIFSEEVEQY